MDTQEVHHLAEKKAQGKRVTDQGQYYHEAWWEAYKGAPKGMMGGLFVGGGAGVAIGGVVATALAAISGFSLGLPALGAVVLGFTAMGAYHGAKEFSQVGIVTGAVAAAHEKAEERMKEFEDSRFVELKREIRGLKAFVTGKKEAPDADLVMDGPESRAVDAAHADYQTQHCDDEHCPPNGKVIFWKVAGIGLGVGLAAGGLLGGAEALGAGVFMGEMLNPVKLALGLDSAWKTVAASTVVGGAVGASFGINRDLFRRVFDVTDHWFHGVAYPLEKGHAAAATPAPELPIPSPAEEPSPRVLLVSAEALKSGTFFQDAALTRRATLLALDHTHGRPN